MDRCACTRSVKAVKIHCIARCNRATSHVNKQPEMGKMWKSRTFQAFTDQSVCLSVSSPVCASLLLSCAAQSLIPGIRCADAGIAGWIPAAMAALPAVMALFCCGRFEKVQTLSRSSGKSDRSRVRSLTDRKAQDLVVSNTTRYRFNVQQHWMHRGVRTDATKCPYYAVRA